MAEERRVRPEALHDWIVRLWTTAGSSPREATLTADHLVRANLTGHDSHGVGMVHRYVQSFLAGELQLNQSVEVAFDGGAMLIVDGRRGMGQSVAHQAMALGIARARETGLALLGLRNAHHIGRIGHWAEQAIDAGLASIHFTNAVAAAPMVAPHGGAQARFLTNPFTVGVPRPGGEPWLLDFATSAIAHGKVRVAHNKGVAVPPGSLLDAAGRPTTDPAVMFEPDAAGLFGAMQTAAGHKGYAIAVMCELLGAALTGGETAHPANWSRQFAIWNNMLVVLIDPARLGDPARFLGQAEAFEAWARSARPLDGQAVELPGDPERRAFAERSAAGTPIDAGTMRQLDEAATMIEQVTGREVGPLSALALR